MTLYVPAASAQQLSEALWRLSVPARLPRSTRYLFTWVTALDESVWLVVDPDHQINVHPEAVLDGIADILQPWIDGGHLPADTNEVLAAVVLAHRGQVMTLWEFFPQHFKDLSKTYAEMVAGGLLPNITP